MTQVVAPGNGFQGLPTAWRIAGIMGFSSVIVGAFVYLLRNEVTRGAEDRMMFSASLEKIVARFDTIADRVALNTRELTISRDEIKANREAITKMLELQKEVLLAANQGRAADTLLAENMKQMTERSAESHKLWLEATRTITDEIRKLKTKSDPN